MIRPRSAPLSDDQIQAKQKQIDDLLKRARAGEDFAALAKQYSEDPGSKDNGGELPSFARGDQGCCRRFEAAAFSLTNNQISDVVTTRLRLPHHQVAGQNPGQKAGVDRQSAAGDVTIADKIKDFLTQQKTEKLAPAYLDKLKKAADVQILDADLKAAAAAAAAAAANAPAADAGKMSAALKRACHGLSGQAILKAL